MGGARPSSSSSPPLPASRPAATGSRRWRSSTATGRHAFQVEIAKDDATRERGLMDRRYMAADRGMLFEFDREAPTAFWMKNTYIPLDMIFIARSGVVTHIVANAEPLSERVIPSGGPCAAVLELNGGNGRGDRAEGRRQGSPSVLPVSRDGRVAAPQAHYRALHPSPSLIHCLSPWTKVFVRGVAGEWFRGLV